MKNENVPLVYVIGGLVIALVFLLFLISGIPRGGSIIPPVGLGIGLLIAVIGFVAWRRRKSHS